MTIPSKDKSHFEQLLSEIYAKKPRKNNQKVCIDCLKPRSKKISLSVKIVVALNFMNSNLKILHFNIVQFLMYKMAVLSKIKPHSHARDYFKELPFYNKPMEETKAKRLKNIDR